MHDICIKLLRRHDTSFDAMRIAVVLRSIAFHGTTSA